MIRASAMILVCVFPVLAHTDEQGKTSTNSNQRNGKVYRDKVCGSRSVVCVLRHFGQDADLAEIIKECQWPDYEKGASVFALSQALQKRGIYSVVLELSNGLKSGFVWPEPIIATISTSESTLHFTTLLPNPDGSWRYSEDFSFFVSGSHDDPSSYKHLLLTSSVPISQDSIRIAIESLNRGGASSVIAIVAICFTILAAFLLVLKTKHRALLPARTSFREGVS